MDDVITRLAELRARSTRNCAASAALIAHSTQLIATAAEMHQALGGAGPRRTEYLIWEGVCAAWGGQGMAERGLRVLSMIRACLVSVGSCPALLLQLGAIRPPG